MCVRCRPRWIPRVTPPSMEPISCSRSCAWWQTPWRSAEHERAGPPVCMCGSCSVNECGTHRQEIIAERDVQEGADTWTPHVAETLRPKLAQLLSPHGEMWQVTEPSPEASIP